MQLLPYLDLYLLLYYFNFSSISLFFTFFYQSYTFNSQATVCLAFYFYIFFNSRKLDSFGIFLFFLLKVFFYIYSHIIPFHQSSFPQLFPLLQEIVFFCQKYFLLHLVFGFVWLDLFLFVTHLLMISSICICLGLLYFSFTSEGYFCWEQDSRLKMV